MTYDLNITKQRDSESESRSSKYRYFSHIINLGHEVFQETRKIEMGRGKALKRLKISTINIEKLTLAFWEIIHKLGK